MRRLIVAGMIRVMKLRTGKLPNIGSSCAFEVLSDALQKIITTDSPNDENVGQMIDALVSMGAAGAIRFDVLKKEFLRRASELWDEAAEETRAIDAEADS